MLVKRTQGDIKPSGDRKTKFWDGQLNTFGLLPGPDGTCPNATCGDGGCWQIRAGRKNPTCYVTKIMAAYPGVRGCLEYNTNLLKSCKTVKEMATLLTRELNRFVAAEDRRCAILKKPRQLYYRIHWSGDMFNDMYAAAWRMAIRRHRNVTFWVYTRSFSSIKYLQSEPNVKLSLSLDKINLKKGLVAFDKLLEHSAGKHAHALSPGLTLFSTRSDLADMKAAIARHYSNKPTHRKFNVKGCPANTSDRLEFMCSRCQRCVTDKHYKNYNIDVVWFEYKE